jgi:glycosyltransferase involved in cell wall biosynthesis
MKILFLGDGRSIHLQRWIGCFNQQGDETCLATLEQPGHRVAETFYIRPKSRLNFVKYFLATGEIRKITEKIKPDLINAHFVPNYGLIGVRLGFKPVVVSVWGSDILVSAQKSLLHRRRASWVLKKADWLTSDSAYMTEEMIKLGADRQEISIFPMGPAQIFLNIPRKKLKEKQELTVISTRRLEPVYNLQLLIMAIPIVISRIQQKMKFIIVGEGAQRKELEYLVASQNLSDIVKFTGGVSEEELVRLLATADIYISTSVSDSTSVSLLEAFACGLIPIVTDIPGNREWVENGVNGFLVPNDEPEALAQRIIEVCNDFTAKQNIVDYNRRLVEQRADFYSHLSVLRRKFTELTDRYKR